jgi:hypothetical protein
MEIAMSKSYLEVGDTDNEASSACAVDTHNNSPMRAPEYLQ